MIERNKERILSINFNIPIPSVLQTSLFSRKLNRTANASDLSALIRAPTARRIEKI